MAYRAEYIWIDGTEPTAEIRSKTKVLADGDDPGIWGFDGSSTNQATGDNSDVVLQPVFPFAKVNRRSHLPSLDVKISNNHRCPEFT